MSRQIPPDQAFLIERALTFLVDEYRKTGHNSKPVVLHSTRVGFQLLEFGYEAPIVVAGILHDLLEDSSVSLTDLEDQFGPHVASCVNAVSFDRSITDSVRQYSELFERTVSFGRAAVAIKAADLYDNSFYYSLVSDPHAHVQLVQMVRRFLDMTVRFSSEPIVRILRDRIDEHFPRLSQ